MSNAIELTQLLQAGQDERRLFPNSLGLFAVFSREISKGGQALQTVNHFPLIADVGRNKNWRDRKPEEYRLDEQRTGRIIPSELTLVCRRYVKFIFGHHANQLAHREVMNRDINFLTLGV